eukprot:1529595-Pyramimonas_sp.AAC.1
MARRHRRCAAVGKAVDFFAISNSGPSSNTKGRARRCKEKPLDPEGHQSSCICSLVDARP